MKTIIFILIFTLSIFKLVAQEADTVEIKVGNTTYMKYTSGDRFILLDQKTSIKNVPANYDVRKEAHRISYSDKNILLQLIKKWLTPFYKKHGIKTDIPDFINNMIFNLHSDMQGNIIGIDFVYNNKYDIPIEILHNFSIDLQKSKFKLIHDQSEILKNAKRFERVYAISCKDIYNLK